MKRSIVVSALVLLFALPAFAFRPRPISDLRFDDLAPVSVASAASDGRDFLVLGSMNDDWLLLGRTQSRVFVQRVVDGAPAGRQLGVGVGAPDRIAWVGTHYLASWADPTGLFVASISRDGTLLADPVKVIAAPEFHFAAMAANEFGAVAVNESTIQKLDLNGLPNGPAIPLPPPPPPSGYDTLTALDDGFALTFSGWGGAGVLRLTREGTPLTPAPVVVEALPTNQRVERAIAAGAGSDVVVLYELSQDQAGAKLKTAVVDAHGVLSRGPQAILTSPIDRALDPRAMLWDGGGYTAVIGVDLDPTGNFADIDPAFLRISSSGDALGGLNSLYTAPRRQDPTSLAFNGREFLVSWDDGTNQDLFGAWVTQVSAATMTPTAPRQIGRILNRQMHVAVGAMNGQYLAAWIETTATSTTLRASRIDAAGNYLDGAGIVLGPASRDPRNGTPATVAIASDGVNWFVVWGGSSVHGVRVATDGRVLDPVPIPIDFATEAAVAWNGTTYVVATSDGSLRARIVTRRGDVGSPITLATAQRTVDYVSFATMSTTFRAPSLAAWNGNVLLTFARHDSVMTEQTSADQASVVGLRLDASGSALDPAPFPIGDTLWSGPSVASDGSRILVVWAKATDVEGILLSADAPQEGGTPFTIDQLGSLPSVAFDGQDFVIAWATSSPFTLATTRIHGGSIFPPSEVPLEAHESVGIPSVGAAPGTHAIIGFDFRHDAYDGVSRAGFVFGETGSGLTVPSAPSIFTAARGDGDAIVVRWQPVAAALGIAIELRLNDGTWREIGVAPGGAAIGRGSLAGLEGNAIRIRAWNGAGRSLPSASVPILNARMRVGPR